MNPASHARTAGAAPVLTAAGLRVALGGVPILHGVDLEARAGEVHGLIGPNGAGKSTLLRALAHLVRPGEGEIQLDGEVGLSSLRARERATVVGFLPQDTGVDLDFTARAIVAMGRYAHLSRWSQPGAADEQIVTASLERAGVAHLAERSVRTLSGGQRQLVMLAKQLAQAPRAYLLDEPVSALDLAHQLEIVALMSSLADDGAAVVAVLHDITLAARACDRLTVLQHGRIYATGPPDDVLTVTMLAEVYGVRARVENGPEGLTVTPLQPLRRP
ncbi:ABC transporter ATP-binding protein [Bogoriella caseilytica]|uniref:Iron complex transport system ATP-binding protein n=1 Tax=Bogoriella caseilytica TaxID=56055 RepID=A0A3N2BAH0_9MICO|nr:ABC transporter ATP-binding protein [Bogoriella caseilytica]ROR72271.1 iron complex transport system ATP-binding protein [Bogoriella caseilytica]